MGECHLPPLVGENATKCPRQNRGGRLPAIYHSSIPQKNTVWPLQPSTVEVVVGVRLRLSASYYYK